MNVQTKPFRRYSVRRTNPFQGVVQIVSSTDSRALSLDGVNWEIQIRTQPPGDTWGGTPAIQQEKRFLRFGVWSTTEGLKKVPANPILDLTKMLETADELLEVLKTSHNHLPFPLADRFECWLLDGKKRSPLALLSSTVHSDRLQTPINPRG